MNGLEKQSTEQFMVMKHGKQLGPYQKTQLLENVKTGNFNFNDLIWQPQMQNWEELRYHVTTEDLSRAGIPHGTLNKSDPTKTKDTVLITSFGFHPATATLTVLVDLIVFGGTVVSLGLAWIILLFVSVTLGVISFLIQRKWYGDDDTDALIKGLIVLVLTAIPLPIATALMIYSGITGKVKSNKQLA